MQRLSIYFLVTILIIAAAFSGCKEVDEGVIGFAYVANSGSDNVTAYSISGRTGELTFIGNIGAGAEPYSVTTDPAGNFVYVVNHSSQNISIYSINRGSGALTETSDSPVATVYNHASSIILNPHQYSYYIYGFVVYSDGSLITPYSTDSATGKLTIMTPDNPISAGSYSWCIASDPTGKFIYTANRESNNISAFSIASTSKILDTVTGSPFPADSKPWSIACDPSGKFLYVVNYSADNVTAYTIDASTGALTLVGSYSAGTNPRSIVCHPSGKFLYVANTNSNNISAYSINGGTGELTGIIGSPVDNGLGTIPVAITVEPSGRFAYVVNNYSDNVQVYAIDSTSGALTRTGNPIAAGHWPVSIITVRK